MYASLHKLKDIPARWQLTFQCTEEYYVFLQVKSNAQDFGNLPIQSAEVYNVLCIRSKVETMPSVVASCHFMEAQHTGNYHLMEAQHSGRVPIQLQAHHTGNYHLMEAQHSGRVPIQLQAQHTGNYHLMEAQHSGRVPIQLQAQQTGNYHFNGGATLRRSAISNAGEMEVNSAGEPYRNNKASTSDRTQSRKQKELILKPKFHSYWISRSIRRIKKNYVRPT